MTMRENAAKVADAHVGEASRERQRKGFKSSAESDAEERGENIAAKLIADKIRALPDVPNPTRAALEETLFDSIKHGDSPHQDWLKEAIRAHFAGDPIPPATGDSRKRVALEECVRAMEQTEWVQEDDSGWEVYVCPSCGEYKLDGHAANCIKAKALKSARTALQETEK